MYFEYRATMLFMSYFLFLFFTLLRMIYKCFASSIMGDVCYFFVWPKFSVVKVWLCCESVFVYMLTNAIQMMA